jgi:NADH pyrophosphatase NudC (nudix superfamily)
MLTREVIEETGLGVLATGILGRRVHPRTGRTLVYMSATPVSGTAVSVTAPDELAEVRWASLTEADKLLRGMFGLVRDYVTRMLGT